VQHGTGALTQACWEGHLECVHALLKAGAPVAQAEQDGSTALMLASRKCHAVCVRALLEAGAQVEQAKPDGVTALIWACQHGQVDCVRALFEAGAPVSKIANGSFSVHVRAPDHLPLLQLLCVLGAQRCDLTELELDEIPEECGASIRTTWRWRSELHHLELLIPARLRELLIEGLIRTRRCRRANAAVPRAGVAATRFGVNHSMFPACARARGD
jgi:ankyrin repeat protein